MLDIQNKFRKNGRDAEWLLLWKKIIRIAKKMLKLEEIPKALQVIIKSLLLSADVNFIGGGEKDKKKAVDTAISHRKFDVPTIIYKDKSGYTGAQRNER